MTPPISEDDEKLAGLLYRLVLSSAVYGSYEVHPDGSLTIYRFNQVSCGFNNVQEAVGWLLQFDDRATA